MIDINLNEIKRFESDLKTFAAKAYPFATRDTLNTAAFHAQRLARGNVRNTMTLRNNFTVRTIRVERAKTLNVRQQSASVGSTVDYMEDQEFGSVKKKRSKEGLPIQTSYSAGLSENAQPRTRLPRRPNKLQTIRLRRARVKGTKKQRTLLKVRDAVKSGRRFIYLETKRKKGLFKVVGGRKGSKRGWPKGAKIKMVVDLTEQSIRIPARPWLRPAVVDTEPELPKFYIKALTFQLKRRGLFK